MKILFVTSSFLGGGITSYAHEVVNCFAKDNEMSVMIGDDKKSPFDRNKIKVYQCEMTNVSVKNAQLLLHLINDEIKPDIILNSNGCLMSLVIPYIDNSIRIISISHSLRYNEADVAGFNATYVDDIIALSTYNKAYLCSTHRIKEENKVHIVYNFVNDAPNATQIFEMKKKAKPLRIVFAGGTAAAKSPELVYDIMQGLLKTTNEFEFYFMGHNSPTLKSIQKYDSLQDLFAPDPRVRFTGRVSRKEAEGLINSANIFLIPSRREGCPMAMLEAMRTGTILITSDYKNACREMIEDGINGFVISHDDKNAFVERINDILLNHEKYFGFYDECYKNYKERFSFDIWKQQMQAIIESKDFMHSNRFSEFSETKFKWDLYRLRSRMKYNKYHLLFFETLKSAIPFYLKHLKNT